MCMNLEKKCAYYHVVCHFSQKPTITPVTYYMLRQMMQLDLVDLRRWRRGSRPRLSTGAPRRHRSARYLSLSSLSLSLSLCFSLYVCFSLYLFVLSLYSYPLFLPSLPLSQVDGRDTRHMQDIHGPTRLLRHRTQGGRTWALR